MPRQASELPPFIRLSDVPLRARSGRPPAGPGLGPRPPSDAVTDAALNVGGAHLREPLPSAFRASPPEWGCWVTRCSVSLSETLAAPCPTAGASLHPTPADSSPKVPQTLEVEDPAPRLPPLFLPTLSPLAAQVWLGGDRDWGERGREPAKSGATGTPSSGSDGFCSRWVRGPHPCPDFFLWGTPVHTACHPSPMRALWELNALRRGEDRGSRRTEGGRGGWLPYGPPWCPLDATPPSDSALHSGGVGGSERRWEEG